MGNEHLAPHWSRITKKFLGSRRWVKVVRPSVIERLGGVCCKCGSSDDINIDHVIGRWYLVDGKEWYNPSNLQPLCRTCNKEKGSKYADYRTESQLQAAEELVIELGRRLRSFDYDIKPHLTHLEKQLDDERRKKRNKNSPKAKARRKRSAERRKTDPNKRAKSEFAAKTRIVRQRIADKLGIKRNSTAITQTLLKCMMGRKRWPDFVWQVKQRKGSHLSDDQIKQVVLDELDVQL